MACHLPYLLPVLGLLLFWLLPWQTALPLYLVLVGVSAIYAWVTVRTFRQPVQTGREAMIGAEGIVKESVADDSFVQHAHRMIAGLRQQPLGELVCPSSIGV